MTTVPSSNAKKYEQAGRVQRALIERFQRVVLEHLARRRFSTVLDVGCGEGYFARALLDRFPGIRVRGVDASAQAIAEARTRCPEGRFDVASFEDLDGLDERFDLVVCSEVLEHVPHPSVALSALVKRTAGALLLTVPREPWFWLANLSRGKYLATLGNHPEHIQHWTLDGFAHFVEPQVHVDVIESCFPWTVVVGVPR